MEKPKTPMNQLTTLYGPNAQKVFMFNEIFLKWEYSAVISFDGNCVILNIFKNVGTDTSYFTKQFSPRKGEFRIQKMNKKAKEQSKMQRKKLRAIRKNHIDKKKRKRIRFL